MERGDYISYANCGLPYHVGGVIPSRDALLVQTPEAMKKKFNIDVRIRNEVMSIDREKKVISVRKMETGEMYEESYDTLVIATGSSPLRPPIPGIQSDRIQTLWTVNDTDRIRMAVQQQHAKTAAVIGAASSVWKWPKNLHHAGLSVSLIEAADQVMAPLDPEMAAMLHANIRKWR